MNTDNDMLSVHNQADNISQGDFYVSRKQLLRK
ncbi:hypothetical protein UFOVP322_4 [uncultured Caudovirales phage]|uniref:Uncharacterized protein n=1 Tax=uncultured Caudovirales phage TaxID=2100421 RepID=A0A6J5NS89_9CAUD|nr:hypothetical protein UFOVP322_4 [uncultured Caudovirales phage]CAB4160536.1 hypothetical protein UFOVP771_2 [uncultured Caudovirales phage]CAB4165939.1 hypothetical protein UFOVP850_2 [uncultured Caudovirales phage]